MKSSNRKQAKKFYAMGFLFLFLGSIFYLSWLPLIITLEEIQTLIQEHENDPKQSAT